MISPQGFDPVAIQDFARSIHRYGRTAARHWLSRRRRSTLIRSRQAATWEIPNLCREIAADPSPPGVPARRVRVDS